MNKRNYQQDNPLYELFYGEKNEQTEWFTLNAENEKIWNVDKVKHFWETLRAEKMTKKDYDFSEFIFPEFLEDSFWLTNETKEFTEEVNFYKAKFEGKADFDSARFAGEATFGSARFVGEAYFRSARFAGEADFWSARFARRADFWLASFARRADFGWANFAGAAYFGEARFARKAYFRSARFAGMGYFEWANFAGEATFGSASFARAAYFVWARFAGAADFGSASFARKATFRSARFAGKATFRSASFARKATFRSARFAGKATFRSIKFAGAANFGSASFTGKADFGSASFGAKLFFSDIYCFGAGSLRFFNTIFSDKEETSFKNLHLFTPDKPYLPRILFEQVVFTDQVVFLNTHFRYVQFVDCELTDVKIGNCNFPKKKLNNRLLLSNEPITKTTLALIEKRILEDKENQKVTITNLEDDFNKLKQLREEHKLPTHTLEQALTGLEKAKEEMAVTYSKGTLKLNHYKMMAVTYRQLKTNRAANKDWGTAGDTYRSEMEMTRKAVWQEFILPIEEWWSFISNFLETTPTICIPNSFRAWGKVIASSSLLKRNILFKDLFTIKPWLLINLFIIWLHGALSGYQQSISRTLLFLVLIIVGFGLGFGYYYSCYCQPTILYPYQTGFKESFYAAFPLSGSIEEGVLKLSMVIERVVSVILITFFVLSTRARLKQ